MQKSNYSSPNCKVRFYPTGDCEAIIFNYSAFCRGNKKTDDHLKVLLGDQISFEDIDKNSLKPYREKSKYDRERNRSDSILRSKNKVFDIAIMNEWDYFVTLTLDKTKISRFDPKLICPAFINWLDHMKKRKSLKYLFVPEFHEDGEIDEFGRKAIHFHGFVSGDLDLVDSGLKSKGKTVYNLKNWKYGFTTAVKIDGSPIAVAKYITKYITKDMHGVLPHMYYAGGGVCRTVPEAYYFVDFNSVPVSAHDIGVAVGNKELAVKYVKFSDEVESLEAFDVQNWLDL